jgi:hypothetical protein
VGPGPSNKALSAEAETVMPMDTDMKDKEPELQETMAKTMDGQKFWARPPVSGWESDCKMLWPHSGESPRHVSVAALPFSGPEKEARPQFSPNKALEEVGSWAWWGCLCKRELSVSAGPSTWLRGLLVQVSQKGRSGLPVPQG